MSTESVLDSTAVDPLIRTRVRNGRRVALVIALVLVGTLVLAWLGSGAKRGALDPEAYDGNGSRAVAALLEEQGVSVIRVRTSTEAVDAVIASGGARTSLLVTTPDLLTATKVDRLVAAAPATVVLLAPTQPEALGTWAPGVTVVGPATNDVREPQCTWRSAQLAGSARAGGAAYTVGAVPPGTDVESCYPFENDPTVIHLARNDDTATTVLGDPLILTNDEVASDGNAALAMNALGEHPVLVWYLPSVSELDAAAQKSFIDLIPSGVKFAAIQLGLVVLLVAAWRVRRLGPVVVEPLPVVVRASETVEGRGRLYRRVRAHDRAAAALRSATIDRLRRRTGLPIRCTPDMIVAAVAARSSRSDVEVRGLLYGAVPADDAALVHLADALDSLEGEVNRS